MLDAWCWTNYLESFGLSSIDYPVSVIGAILGGCGKTPICGLILIPRHCRVPLCAPHFRLLSPCRAVVPGEDKGIWDRFSWPLPQLREVDQFNGLYLYILHQPPPFSRRQAQNSVFRQPPSVVSPEFLNKTRSSQSLFFLLP